MLPRAVLLRDDNCVYNLPLDRCLPLKSAPDERGQGDGVPRAQGLAGCPWPCPPVLRADRFELEHPLRGAACELSTAD